ncbi:MAG TPA: c-type cytochrome [Thermoanaerobaculia bacterium]|nr:c-type cytochrome [Thermoanaerobaculia bacterium]
MPRKPPAEPIDHHYDIPKLTRVFALSGLIVLITSVAMIWTDYASGWNFSKSWKGYQLRFLQWDRYKTQKDVAAAREKVSRGEYAAAQAELRQADAEEAENRRQIAELEKKIKDTDAVRYRDDQNYRFQKAVVDTARYELEVAEDSGKSSRIRDRQKNFDDLAADLKQKQLKLQASTAQLDAFKSQRDALTAKAADADKKKKTLLANFDLAAKKLTTLREDPVFKARNAPILDMVNPSLKIQQVILPDLFNDVNFMKIPRVDRCESCHIAADKKGYTPDVLPKLPEVFQSHSNLPLILGSESPHPLPDFGCTSCHGGHDRSTSFFHTAHQPSSKAEEGRWKKKYGWELDEFVEMPIYPIEYAQAGCYRCHAQETNFPLAPRLDAGMRVIEGLGCWGCHRIKGLEAQNLPKVGPSLEKVAAKVSPDWAIRWISNPAVFRPNTKMPRFFYLDNFVRTEGIDPKTGRYRTPNRLQRQDDEAGRRMNDTMIRAIASYIFEKSQKPAVPALGLSGDAAHGKWLFENRGCQGCHILDPNAKRDLIGTYRQFGPNLAGIGSKTTPDWIAMWVKDPKAWNPETKMPNLRLTDPEAADLAAYLSQQKAPPAFDAEPIPAVDKASLDRVSMYFETTTKSIVDAQNDLAKMTMPQELSYAGEKLIGHYGCYACHAIPGFEEAKPIGTELSEWGNKAVHRLDFGFIDIDHTRQDWLRTKLTNTRIYDQDKVRGWEEKLKMPLFSFSEEEKTDIVTAVLGFQKDDMADAKRKHLSPDEAAIERGRRIVKDHNCQGCHVIEGKGGSIRETMADVSFAPPIIKGEGAKVQSDWLFEFLNRPQTGQIRPWLQVHMPTFGFTDAQLNDLTKYFAALSKASYPFVLPQSTPDAMSVAAGKKVFEMYRCAQCHPRSQQEADKVEDKSSLAPNLEMAHSRLRHDWINDWISRPDEWMPGTRMPTNFPKDDTTGQRYVTLALGWDSPQIAKDRAELEKMMGGPQAASEFIHSVDRVTKALRDYVWSIGGNEPPAAASSAASAASPAGAATRARRTASRGAAR